MKKIAIGLAGVVVLAAILFVACPEEKKAEAPAPTPVAAAPAPTPPAPAVPAAPAGKGTISGEVHLTGTPPVMEPLKRGADPVCAKTAMNDESALIKDGKIENVVLRVRGPQAPAPSDKIQVVQKDCMYRPRVQAGQMGQEVSVANEDTTLHNVHAYGGSKTLFNRAQPAKSQPIDSKVDADAQGVVKLKCDVHPWMTGYVVLNTNPWFAVTKADGKFEIKDVPAGQYTLEAWHEKFGTKTVSVTVAPDQTAKVEVAYSADDRG